MNITFDELRKIKHELPTGSIAKIANTLGVEEQTVRNYFGASDYDHGDIPGVSSEPGPNGGIIHLEDTTILDLAREIISESGQSAISHS